MTVGDLLKQLGLGIHPVPPRGTLLIFKTENDAKRARNLISQDLKCETGANIMEIFIPEEYAKGGGHGKT